MRPNQTDIQSDFLENGIIWPLKGPNESSPGNLLEKYRQFQSNAVKHRGREIHLKPHLVSTWLDSIVCDTSILDVVESAIGPNILLWSSDFAVKGAGLGTWIPWHQDTPYWNLSTTEVVSVWYAITDANIDNGAMKVVTGTHRSGGGRRCLPTACLAFAAGRFWQRRGPVAVSQERLPRLPHSTGVS